MPKHSSSDDKVVRKFEAIMEKVAEFDKSVSDTVKKTGKAGVFRNGGLDALSSAKGTLKSRLGSAVTLKAELKHFTQPPQRLNVSPVSHKALQKDVKACQKTINSATALAKKAIAEITKKQELAGESGNVLKILTAEYSALLKIVELEHSNFVDAIKIKNAVEGDVIDAPGLLSASKKLLKVCTSMSKVEGKAKTLKNTKLPSELSGIQSRVYDDFSKLEIAAYSIGISSRILVRGIDDLIRAKGTTEQQKLLYKLHEEMEQRKKEIVNRVRLPKMMDNISDTVELLLRAASGG